MFYRLAASANGVYSPTRSTQSQQQRPPLRRAADIDLRPTAFSGRVALAADDDNRQLRSGALMKRCAELVRPVLAALESDTASLAPVAGNEKLVQALRSALLALWDCILDWLEPQYEMHAARDDLGVAYNTLALIAARPEFDASCLQLDAHSRPLCDALTLGHARSYRRLLLKTHHFVTTHLGAATQLSSTQPFTLYAVRSLAASYFRVPSNEQRFLKITNLFLF